MQTNNPPERIVQQLLSELEPTKHPNRRIGPRAVKRVIVGAAFPLGGPDYLSEREFAKIASEAGFPTEPRQGGRTGRSVCSWWLGVTRRSVQQFVDKHRVTPV